MRRLLRTFVMGAVLAVAGASVTLADTAADPAVGTWTLNLEKSKFSGTTAPKSQTRSYEQTAEGLHLTYTGVAADGSAVSGESTYKYDGKDYPITGSPDFDTLAVTRVSSHEVKGKQKKAGELVGTTTRTISKDGKTMTLASRLKNAKGDTVESTMVFDKQ
jgi:hypothetical protein